MFKFSRRKFLHYLTVTFGGAAASATNALAAASSVSPGSTRSTGPLQFTLSSPVSATLAPFCLGYAFRKGQIPAGQTIASSIPSLQVTPKNYWPDGSLKFAIVAGSAALTADTPVTATLAIGAVDATPALTTADLRATGITASVAAGAFGTDHWASAHWNTHFQTWVSGPQMS